MHMLATFNQIRYSINDQLNVLEKIAKQLLNEFIIMFEFLLFLSHISDLFVKFVLHAVAVSCLLIIKYFRLGQKKKYEKKCKKLCQNKKKIVCKVSNNFFLAT